MGSFKDLTGQTFGRLTAVGRSHKDRLGWYWHCQCECGTTTIVVSTHLSNGATKSCGCLSREVSRQLRTIHGESVQDEVTPEYSVWSAMLRRCHNPNCADFANYGGRGITVCDRWAAFENFLADMGRRPPGTSIDRIDNDGNYEPANCRWATAREQRINQRRHKP